ncbi:hypothetical protein EV126DRAFT_432951, partial [Verticillium dahliae]
MTSGLFLRGAPMLFITNGVVFGGVHGIVVPDCPVCVTGVVLHFLERTVRLLPRLTKLALRIQCICHERSM